MDKIGKNCGKNKFSYGEFLDIFSYIIEYEEVEYFLDKWNGYFWYKNKFSQGDYWCIFISLLIINYLSYF